MGAEATAQDGEPWDSGRTGRSLTWSLAAAGTVTAVFALSNAPTPLYALWQKQWNFTAGTLTVVFAAYMLGLIATLVVAGKLADRYGRRIVLVPGLAAAVTASLLFLLAPNVLWLLGARLAAGVAVGAAVTAGMAATVDLAASDRKRAASLIASASMVFGAGLGPLLAGAISQNSDNPLPWVFGCVLALTISALVVALLLPLADVRSAGSSQPRTRSSLWAWPTAPRTHRHELAWGIATFAPGITATSFVLSLGPSVLARNLGTSSTLLAGIVACVMFLAATGIQFALAKLPTRTHLALSSITTVAAMALLAATMLIWPHPALFILSAVLSGAGQGLGQLAGLALIGTRFPADRRAEGNAALNIAGYIPAALLPVATGYLIDATTMALAVTIFAAVVGVVALLALVLVRRDTARRLRIVP